jgi:hypothetical protein
MARPTLETTTVRRLLWLRRAILTLAVLGTTAASLAVAPLDIEVYGLNVLPLKDGKPQSPAITTGAPGVEYYLLCAFKPVGTTANTATRFVFRANGVIVDQVNAPVEANQYVTMGHRWTPVGEGTYSLTCQANPDHQPVETTYANNLRTASFKVQKPLVDPGTAIGIEKKQPPVAIKPGAGNLTMSPCPAGWHLTGAPTHDGKAFFCAPNKPPKLSCAPGFVYYESKEGGLIGCVIAFPVPTPPEIL